MKPLRFVDRKEDPFYFEVVTCSAEGCTVKHDLLKHKYTDEMMCVDHVNELARKLAEENESAEENEALTLLQRNS